MRRWIFVVIVIIVAVGLISVVTVGGILIPQKYGLEKVKSQGKVIMATEATSPPFESWGPYNRTYYGFDIDLAKKIVENVSARTDMNITLEIRDEAIASIPSSLESNQIDASLSSIAISSIGNESVLFSVPYYSKEVAYGLMVKNGTTGIASIEDVVSHDKKIVVKTGTSAESWVQENLVNTGKVPADRVKSLPTTSVCVREVVSGNSDVFIIDKSIVSDYIMTTAGSVNDVGTIQASESYGVAFNKNSGDLKAIADEVIRNMTSNGEMDSLRAYWGL